MIICMQIIILYYRALVNIKRQHKHKRKLLHYMYSPSKYHSRVCMYVCVCVCVRVCVPQGGTLIFSYIRRLGPFLGVQNFKFNIFAGFQKKMIIFGGMSILWIFLGGHHKIELHLGGHFYPF